MPFSPVIYGVELAGPRVILVRARGARSEPIADPAALRDTLARDLAAGRARLVAAAGAHESVLRRLVVPLAAADKARRVLPSQLDVALPFPLESCVYAFPQVEPAGDGQTEALAVAVRRTEWEALLCRHTEALAEPTDLDHEGLALWEEALHAAGSTTPAGLHGVLHVAHDHVTLALGRGERLLATPALRRGDESLAALLARFTPTLRALLPGEADAACPWLLTGPGLNTRGAAAELQAARPGSADRVAAEPATFLTRALVRRAAGRGRWPCNLRQGADEHPAVRRRRARQAARAQALALAAGLVLLVGSLVGRSWLQRETAQAHEALNREAMQVTGLSRVPRGQEVELVRRALADQGKREDVFLAAVSGSTLELVTRLSAAAREAGATLDRLRLEGSVFELAGRSTDHAAGERLVAALAAQGWNSELLRGEAAAGEPLAFTVKGAR
jgi:hypothetical protein